MISSFLYMSIYLCVYMKVYVCIWGCWGVFLGSGLIFDLSNQWIGCATVPSARRPKFGFAGLRNYCPHEMHENLLQVQENPATPLANALKSLAKPWRRKENEDCMRIRSRIRSRCEFAAEFGSRQKRIEVDARIKNRSTNQREEHQHPQIHPHTSIYTNTPI